MGREHYRFAQIQFGPLALFSRAPYRSYLVTSYSSTNAVLLQWGGLPKIFFQGRNSLKWVRLGVIHYNEHVRGHFYQYQKGLVVVDCSWGQLYYRTPVITRNIFHLGQNCHSVCKSLRLENLELRVTGIVSALLERLHFLRRMDRISLELIRYQSVFAISE